MSAAVTADDATTGDDAAPEGTRGTNGWSGARTVPAALSGVGDAAAQKETGDCKPGHRMPTLETLRMVAVVTAPTPSVFALAGGVTWMLPERTVELQFRLDMRAVTILLVSAAVMASIAMSLHWWQQVGRPLEGETGRGTIKREARTTAATVALLAALRAQDRSAPEQSSQDASVMGAFRSNASPAAAAAAAAAAVAAAVASPRPSEGDTPSGPQARLPAPTMEPPEVPEDLLRAVVEWRAPEPAPPPRKTPGDDSSDGGAEASPEEPETPTEAEVEALRQRHTCPICREVMLRPQRLRCGHHACGRCLASRCEAGGPSSERCPHCDQPSDLQALLPPVDDLIASLAHRRCACAACGGFEGSLDQLKLHLLGCPSALGFASLHVYRLAVEGEERRLQPGPRHADTVSATRLAMLGSSPALVHHIPAHAVSGPESFWSSPPFTACGHVWTMRSGPIGASMGLKTGSNYFCFLPHGHTERLRCNLYFARLPGQGFKERRLHDWPVELAGHPWGVTLKPEEIERCRQADGSLLVMVHAIGLGAEGDLAPPPMCAQDSSACLFTTPVHRERS